MTGLAGSINLLVFFFVWLLPLIGVIVLLLAVWRMMKAQEDTALALREIAENLRRQ